jgi:hypothetical protein
MIDVPMDIKPSGIYAFLQNLIPTHPYHQPRNVLVLRFATPEEKRKRHLSIQRYISTLWTPEREYRTSTIAPCDVAVWCYSPRVDTAIRNQETKYFDEEEVQQRVRESASPPYFIGQEREYWIIGDTPIIYHKIETGAISKREKQRICTIDGCNNPHVAKGLCMKHWRQQRRSRQKSEAICE